MTYHRRNLVGKEILSYLLDNDQKLALKISYQATEIASPDQHKISVEEIEEFLDPWVQNQALKNRSH